MKISKNFQQFEFLDIFHNTKNFKNFMIPEIVFLFPNFEIILQLLEISKKLKF